MIPYGRQTINQRDINKVVKVLKSDWLTQGPKILEFEKKIAEYCGAKYSVVASSGTAALHLAYMVSSFKIGDEVITTPNTFVATTNMLLVTGARPVFCDIRLDTFNIDENKIEKLITKKTKAIVPVHFAGQPCEMNKIKDIARKHNLLIIEDACHALGAKYKNSKIGSCLYSDMAVFSFHPVKSITTGEGGAILTNNKNYYKRLMFLRSQGIYKDQSGKNVMSELGYNYRMTDIQAALGASQLERLDDFIKKRRIIVGWYKKALSNVKEIILPKEVSESFSGWHLYVIRVKDSRVRNRFSKYLKDKGIGSNFHYPAVYDHPFYKQLGYRSADLINEEIYKRTCVTIPCYPNLSKEDVEYVSKSINKFFE